MARYLLFACILFGPTRPMGGSRPPAADSTETPRVQQPARQSGYPNPTIRLDSSALRRYDSALNSLSQLGRVAILCEGQPLRMELTDAEVTRFSEAVELSGAPLEKAVEQLAAAFDYECTRTGAAMFVLTKRYSDPNDLPDVRFEEAVGSLESILRATRNFVPAFSKQKAIRMLLLSSSEEQRARLTQGVPVTMLSPAHRELAWQFACSFVFAFGGLENVSKVAYRLKGCRSPKAYFTKKTYWNLVLPAYEGPFGGPHGLPGAIWSVALSRWVITQSGGGTTFEGPPGVELVDGDTRIVSKQGLTDPTTPRPRDQITPIPSSSLTCSLGELAERINRRLQPSANPDLPPVKVEPFLASKAVCLAGEQFASPGALLMAAADVYGLHIRRLEDSTMIVPPIPRVQRNGNDVGAEIRRLLPAPFLRAVTDDPAFKPEGGFSENRGTALYVASVRRLREIIEPEIDRREDGKLPLLEAGHEARDLVALSSLATCLYQFHHLTRPQPSFVTQFDGATFSLSPTKTNPNEIEYFIKAVNAEGKTSGVAGSLTFPPPPSRTRPPRRSNSPGRQPSPN